MEENLEQPQLNGSKEFGKFKDAESLLQAYNNLESEFTKKSQRLANLENERILEAHEREKQTNIERKVEDFTTKFELAKPFKSALKESLSNDENSNLEEVALSLISKSYKSAQDYASDEEFLNNYIFSNKEIKEKIIKDYLKNITQNSPIKVSSSASNISLTPPSQPQTISEAGRLAKSIIKNK